jgi:predicted permease
MRVLGYAARGLRRAPELLALVVLTLALGIGGTTAVFTVVDGLLMRPLPYPEPHRLVEVWTEEAPEGWKTPGLEGPVLRSLRSRSQAFEAVEAYQFGAATLTGAGEPDLVAAPRVTPGLLRLLGVAPRLGRLFDDDEARTGARVALIAEGLWRSRFGGSDDVLGRSLWIDDEPHVVVGVLPTGFAFPERTARVWRPLAPEGGTGRVQTVVRLAAATSRESLAGLLEALSAQLREAGLLAADRRLVFEDLLQKRWGRRYATALLVMLGAVSLVLLVACVNVTLLLLIRASARRGELALRVALGAGRGQLAGQVLLESLALAVLGCLGGVLLARLLLAAILSLLPPRMMMLSTVAGLDGRALGFALALSGLVCLLVGALPALRVAGTDPISGLRGRAPGTVDRGAERGQFALVVAQLGLVFVLLAGAGLLLRSFVRLVNVDPGFETADLLVLGIQPSSARYRAPGASLRLLEKLETLVEADPAVLSASFSDGAPPSSGFTRADGLEAEGGSRVVAAGLMLPSTCVAPDYFATMGIALVEGRTFARGDPEHAAVVSDGLARRLWGGEPALGRRFRLDPEAPWHTVIGVAKDVAAMGPGSSVGDGMELYRPFPRDVTSTWLTLLIRTDGSSATVLPRARERLRRLDDRLPILEATSMEQRLLESVARPRFFLRLAAAFAGIATLLAGVGVYGTIAHRVARRRHELGVRMALGATRADVVALLLGRGLRMAAAGSAIGAAVSFAVGRVLATLLFETSPHEPAVLAGIAALLSGLVMAASYLPARSGSRLDPSVVLRAE